jgi:hypothetical protein
MERDLVVLNQDLRQTTEPLTIVVNWPALAKNSDAERGT